MPSVKNPNGPSKNRLAARRASARKQSQKAAKTSKDKVVKADQKRGAGGGLLPTSGPRAKLSAKKQRKVDRKLGYALKRKMEADGEVEMKDAAEEKPAKEAGVDTEMDEEIS
ncbi:hypothetical protein PFICI_09476 [Pestalotiopsis fici W106-1]|uniref:Ribosome biogenesis protein ALB1 n=1 Tax=Pestalotiopsis fici (strain W106-1 / CGMCC3.15140) TaxID=1229662 RepID=W3X0F8_PESFW|nr:uncharacterized protein PFICI_09476 [Pestalotiopsis fici W106-1]ETS79623.1 hypothetical protein PFICI_09476 [Pestalotiopsis fici W106-1]